MTEKLNPCPWCGGKELEIRGVSGRFVVCDNGAKRGHYVVGPERKTSAGAIKAWNERRAW